MPTLAELSAYRRLPIDVARAEGVELVLEDGRRVLDLYGGHCVNALGAGDPELLAALVEQWRTLSFQTNLIATEARARLERTLEPLLPEGDWRLFLANSGAEAVENALKVALLATGRAKVACFSGAFHGRTAAAMAVSDGTNKAWEGAPFEVARLPFGTTEGLDSTFGAVIVEPIESLAGVVESPPGFLEALRARCDALGAALVFDEVQTAPGRLGTPFAAQHFGVVPDVIVTAKGLGGGFPIGAVLARAKLADGVPGDRFGSTFGGGPLACAAAAHVLSRIGAPGFLERVRAASAALAEAARRGPVRRVRGAGLLLGLELEEGLEATAVRDALLERDVLVGTCRDRRVLRLSPPLVIGAEHTRRFARAFESLEVPA